MIINGNKTDPNKLLPMRLKNFWTLFKTGQENNWRAEEVSLIQDIEQWKHPTILTQNERRMIMYNLGFFSTAESLTGNNLVLAIYKHITNPEARVCLLRMAYEEALHQDTFVMIVSTLLLDPEEIYNMYIKIPSIKEKDEFVVNLTKHVMNSNFNTEGKTNTQDFLRDIIGFYIMESLFFYAGFAMQLSLKRRNKMTGIGELFDFILRDETNHLAISENIIETIKNENPEVWDENFKQEMTELFKQAVILEEKYVYDAIPEEGILGLIPQTFCQYVKYIANRRLESIGLEKLYNVENPFPWISQTTTPKETNFFEKTVTEYATGRLEW